EGRWYHTGTWPHEGVDFTGQRVGVIGTGSSAIQSIPIIARQASHLFVFQRTPNYSVPARNAPLDPDYERRVKTSYAEFRRQARESRVGFVVERSEESALAVAPEERRREYEKRWSRGGLGFSAAYADLLTSQEANDTAARFFRDKIRGIAVAGFPNLFLITGPGSPSVLSNMIVSIEQHVDWIADCIAYLSQHGRDGIEATAEAEEAWVAHVNEVGHATLYPLAKSWYM